jgi:ferredoxin
MLSYLQGTQMKIKADRNRCASSGQCVATSLELFDQDPTDGAVIVLDSSPSPALHEKARTAAYLCPTGAIIIDENATDEEESRTSG